jgi:hypothetical protein
MKKKTNSRKNKLLALFLSLMMATSTLAAFASCTDGDSSSSSSSSDEEQTEETVKDEGIITNADFETFNNNKGLNPIVTSVTGWTRSVNSATSGTALSSKAASGIIDTQDEAWADLTTSKLDKAASALSEDEAKAIRVSHKNPQIIELYDSYLGKPNSHKAHELLHTHYAAKERFKD